MNDHFIQTHLSNLPLFAQLTPPQLALVAGITQTHRLEPGTLALEQGQPSTGMLVFVSGRGIFTRRRDQGAEQQVGAVNAGQFVNEASLFEQRLEPVSLRIVEGAIILFIPREGFLRMIGRYPEIRANLRVQGQAQSQAISPRPAGTIPTMNPNTQPVRAAAQPTPGLAQQAYPAAAPSQPLIQPAAPPQEPERVVGTVLFTGQRADEQVLHIFRRHWWAFGRHMWIPAVIAAVLLIIAVVTSGSSPALAVVALAFMIILPGLISVYLYFEWRNDSIVLTDQRVVRIWNFVIGFEKSLSEITLDRVLEVSISVPPGDPFARLFNYATIYIRTSGDSANMNLDLMADAKDVQELIFAQREQFKVSVSRQHQSAIQADIQTALGESPTRQANSPYAAPEPEQAPVEVDNRGLPFIRTRFLDAEGQIVYRRHATVWLSHVFLPGLLLIAGITLGVISTFVTTLPFSGIIGDSVAIVIIIIGGAWFYLSDWDWRHDMLIIGQDALTITHKRPLWLQNETERVRLSQIDNVASDVNGVLDNLLNRGEIRISLIGSSLSEAKRFDKVHDPESIQSEVSRRLAILRARRQNEDVEQQRQVMLNYLAAYHQMQGTTQGGNVQVQPGMTFTRPSQAQLEAQDPNAPPAPPTSDNVRPPRVPRSRP